MLDTRTLKFLFMNDHGFTHSWKFDRSLDGDLYWIFPETGYKISFHKSGQVHLKNNFDNSVYEEFDFSEESIKKHTLNFLESHKEIQDVFQTKTFEPEGKTVYAWKLPSFDFQQQLLMNQFVSISGRKATISLDSMNLAETLTKMSPVLYETTDTKILNPAFFQKAIAFDEDGKLYSAGSNLNWDFSKISDIETDSILEMFGPLGKVFEFMTDSNDYYEDEAYEEDNYEFDPFFDNLEIKKF